MAFTYPGFSWPCRLCGPQALVASTFTVPEQDVPINETGLLHAILAVSKSSRTRTALSNKLHIRQMIICAMQECCTQNLWDPVWERRRVWIQPHCIPKQKNLVEFVRSFLRAMPSREDGYPRYEWSSRVYYRTHPDCFFLSIILFLVRHHSALYISSLSNLTTMWTAFMAFHDIVKTLKRKVAA